MSTTVQQYGFKSQAFDFNNKDFQRLILQTDYVKDNDLSIYIKDKNLFYENTWDLEIPKGEWFPKVDVKGSWGVVYLLEDCEFYDDLRVSFNSYYFKEIWDHLPPFGKKIVQMEFFCYVWYNGGDSPFLFSKEK